MPPPTLADTTRRLLGLLPPEELRPFVAGLLADHDDLDALVVMELARRASGDEPSVLVAALQALRLADFTRTARAWVHVLDQHDVPLSMRLVTLNLSLIDGPPPEGIDQRVFAAVTDIHLTQRDVCPLRDALAATVGANTILGTLAACSQPSAAVRLLAPLAGRHLHPTPDTMREDAPLAVALAGASVEDLAAVLSAAREVSLALAEQLVSIAGGQDAVLRRIFAKHPWLTEIEVVEEDGQTVPRARLLPAAGAPDNALNEDVRELARLLLRCVPAADRADVAAVFPGGRPMRVGDYTHATSGLLRQYAHGHASIAWNRARLRIAIAMVADADATRRLDTGRRLLTVATDFLHELSTGWIRDRLTREDRRRLVQLLQRLEHEVEQMRPPPAATTTPGVEDVDEEGQLKTDDPLHTLLHGLVSNLPGRLIDTEPHYPSLAGFVGGTLTSQLPMVEALDWRLLGLTQPPDALAPLRRLLGNLHAILAELAWGDTPRESLAREAQGTSRRASLHHAAERARRGAARRLQIMATDLGQRCAVSGLDAQVVMREEPSETAEAHVWPPHALAILVSVDSLTEWEDAQTRLAEILTTLPVGEPPVTAVPIRAGKIVPSFAVHYISQLWPAPDATTEWSERLPPPHTTPLATATLQAHQALQTLSAIAELARIRDIQPPVEVAAQAAANQFQQARQAIASLPSDPVVDEILGTLDVLAGRVQEELDAPAEGDLGFAANIAKGLEEPNDDFTILAGLSVAAHEWDIDPASAQRLLSI